ncbi:hypothetical protein REPUB_Repub10bG0102300 [Reevesia pubescens]
MVKKFYQKYFQSEENVTILHLQNNLQEPDENLLEYVCHSGNIALDYNDEYAESMLVEFCIHNMQPEFKALLENLKINQFTKLLDAARRTAQSVRSTVARLFKIEIRNRPQTLSTRNYHTKRPRVEHPLVPFTIDENNVLVDQWFNGDVLYQNPNAKVPTEDDKRNPQYCRAHHYVHHPTTAFQMLKMMIH